MQDNAEAKRVTVYNDVDWGLAGRDVECRTVVEPSSPRRAPAATNRGPLEEDFLKALIPVHPGVHLKDGARAAGGVKLDWRTTEDGETELAIESRPEIWSYPFYYDLSQLHLRSGECWLKMQLIVDQAMLSWGF